ncbi:MAG: hypothetical protein A2173_06825 [Planctomycetes bacterium RBG_13_44_8b]|nr:MAG: hypothetical protein A2173_06825 [Planctomycetes bacterium RBG_13_44_8b]
MKTQNALKNLMIIVAAVVIGICSNLVKAADIVVEVESLELSNAPVQDHNEASGGKVVAFDVQGAEAKGEVELEPGQYNVYLIMSGKDDSHDAVYIAVGDTKKRVYPSAHPDFTKTESIFLDISEKTKYQISLTFGEPGVLLDKIVIHLIP